MSNSQDKPCVRNGLARQSIRSAVAFCIISCFHILTFSYSAAYAAAVAPERRFKPRTYRYPEPREVLLLDGEWEYRFPSNAKEPAERFPWKKVETPYVGATNVAALRVTHSYRRTFDMPALAGRRAIDRKSVV